MTSKKQGNAYNAESTLLTQRFTWLADCKPASSESTITKSRLPRCLSAGLSNQEQAGKNGLQAIEYYTRVKTVYVNLGNVEKTY